MYLCLYISDHYSNLDIDSFSDCVRKLFALDHLPPESRFRLAELLFDIRNDSALALLFHAKNGVLN